MSMSFERNDTKKTVTHRGGPGEEPAPTNLPEGRLTEWWRINPSPSGEMVGGWWLYFPLLQPVNAWRCLQRWITLNHELSTKLTELGYNEHQRIFTPAQVGAIVYYLGEP